MRHAKALKYAAFDAVPAKRWSSSKKAIILGIETSCDDTGCAVLDTDGNLLGEALKSQHLIHLNPDVAPSDYHMFPALKKHLGGKKFDSDAEVQKEVNTWLREADGEWYSAGIDKFIVRMRKVLEKNGDYVEK
nr:unnamed protein product [Callosobruchus analis]